MAEKGAQRNEGTVRLEVSRGRRTPARAAHLGGARRLPTVRAMKHPRIPSTPLAVVLLVPLIYVVVLGGSDEPARRAAELLRAVVEVVHAVPSVSLPSPTR